MVVQHHGPGPVDLRRDDHRGDRQQSLKPTPSLPWIAAMPLCPPAKMQLGALHGSDSYEASFGRQGVVWPVAPPLWPSVCRGGCQARMGIIAAACAVPGCRTFALDSRASVPCLHHGGLVDPLGQHAGGDIPRPVAVKTTTTPNASAVDCVSQPEHPAVVP